MNASRVAFVAVVVSLTIVSACTSPPGQPSQEAETLAPNDVLEFGTLYSQNCAACHGPDGRGGAAIALANPVYLAIVDERSMRTPIADGVRGTSMPAFAQHAGGMLTEQQIGTLVNGIRSRWTRPGALAGAIPPAYAATSAGDIRRGEAAYETFCQSCHGADGRGGPKGSAITNDSLLALMSDQGLRTIIIAGRPELNAPDWRSYVPGRPITDQEVTDVVSWIGSHRVAAPGQPYLSTQR